MKFYEILDGAKVMQKLSRAAFTDFDKSYAMYEFSLEYNKAIDFYISERGKIEKMYGDEQGQPLPEHKDEYELAATTLLNQDFEFSKPFSITFDDIKTAKFPDENYLSAQDIMALSKFVDKDISKE